MSEKLVIHPALALDVEPFPINHDDAASDEPCQRDVMGRAARPLSFLTDAILAMNDRWLWGLHREFEREAIGERPEFLKGYAGRRLRIQAPARLPVSCPHA